MYNTMKKLILNANAQYNAGIWDAERYNAYKVAQQRKIKTFHNNGRLTDAEYEELTDLWIEI